MEKKRLPDKWLKENRDLMIKEAAIFRSLSSEEERTLYMKDLLERIKPSLIEFNKRNESHKEFLKDYYQEINDYLYEDMELLKKKGTSLRENMYKS